MQTQLTHVIPALDWSDASFQMSEFVRALQDRAISSRIVTLGPRVSSTAALRCSGVEISQRRLRSKFDLPGLLGLARDLQSRGGIIQTWGAASRAVSWFYHLGWRPALWIITSVGCGSQSVGCGLPLKVDREQLIRRLSIQWNSDEESLEMDNQAPGSCADVGYMVPAKHDSDRQATRTVLRESLNLPADCRLVGMANSLSGEDRLKDAIWAADLLKVVRDDVHLILVGDGPELWRWQRFRDCVQISDRVHFWSPTLDVSPFVECLDCYWSIGVSHRLSWGTMCALGAAVPIVASRVGEQLSVLKGLDGACLAAPGDRAEIARMTIRVLDNPQFAARWGTSAKQRFEQVRGLQKNPTETVAKWINQLVSLE